MTWGAGVPQRPPVTPRQVLRQGRFPPGTPRLEPRLEPQLCTLPGPGPQLGKAGMKDTPGGPSPLQEAPGGSRAPTWANRSCPGPLSAVRH